MKISMLLFTVMILFIKCRDQPVFSMYTNNVNKIIAIQPLGKYNNNDQQLAFISNQLSRFFHIRILLLNPVDVPATFFKRNGIDETCSADSLIKFLSKICNDSIVDVIGLTHSDIYTISKRKFHFNNKDTLLPESKALFGLGYINGNSCIISDYRLMTTDQEIFDHRLQNVVLHEIGHNMGLAHCSTDTCLMSEENGDLPKLDKNSGNYCAKCKRKLRNHWGFQSWNKQKEISN